MIVDDERPLAREERHCALLGLRAALDVKRLPRRNLLVLADAVRVAAGMAERGHGDLSRLRASEVDHDEPERPADRGVGAKPGPKTPAAQLTPSRERIGPLTMMSGVVALVVPDWPWRLNAGSHAASTTASTTGK